MLNVPVNSYGHVGTVSSPSHAFFTGKLDKAVNQYSMHILSLVTDTTFLESAEERRTAVEIISWSNSTKVLDWVVIKLMTPGSEVIQVSAVRQVSDCAMRPGTLVLSVNLHIYDKYQKISHAQAPWPAIVGILTFMNMINTTSKSLKAGNVFILQHLSFYEQLKFHAQLSRAWKKFYNLWAWALIVFCLQCFSTWSRRAWVTYCSFCWQ